MNDAAMVEDTGAVPAEPAPVALYVGIVASVLLHALLMGLQFAPPNRSSSSRSIRASVILLNARGNEKPVARRGRAGRHDRRR
ncbi:MAG: hypothetical protein R3E68_11200 [Burkholderiaceae bacterium]